MLSDNYFLNGTKFSFVPFSLDISSLYLRLVNVDVAYLILAYMMNFDWMKVIN